MTAAASETRVRTLVRPSGTGFRDTLGYGPSTFFGLFLVLYWIGNAILVASMDRPHPLWLLVIVICVVLALLLLRLWRAARIHQGRTAHPGEPWMWDRKWRPSLFEEAPRSQPIPWKAVLRWAVRLVIYAAFWVTFGPLLAGAAAVYDLWQAFKESQVGGVRIAFERFPFRTGETLRIRLGIGEGGGVFERVHLVLRCLVNTRRKAPEGPICKLHYQAEHLLDRLEQLPGRGADVDVAFEVPSDVPGTDLYAKGQVYWELEVDGTSSLGAWHRYYLIPVYAAEDRGTR